MVRANGQSVALVQEAFPCCEMSQTKSAGSGNTLIVKYSRPRQSDQRRKWVETPPVSDSPS